MGLFNKSVISKAELIVFDCHALGKLPSLSVKKNRMSIELAYDICRLPAVSIEDTEFSFQAFQCPERLPKCV